MYLINKDETEHTGQVKHRPKEYLTPYCESPHCVCVGYTLTAICVFFLCMCVCVFIRVCLNVRSPTCGRCIRSDVGTSSQLETASASSTKTSSDREGTTGTPGLLGDVVPTDTVVAGPPHNTAATPPPRTLLLKGYGSV